METITEDELLETESQNSLINDFSDFISEHSNEIFAVLLSILAGANIFQWIKGRKEKKRHLEVEELQAQALQKHDAIIQNLKNEAEKAAYLSTVNDAICHALDERTDDKDDKKKK